MTKPIGVGLLGAGFIGQMHSLSLGDVSRARREPIIHPALIAIAERNETLAHMMADRYGWREIVTDWRSLVSRSDVDLFVNAGPNQLHGEPSIAAAQSGKHVFCEKPLARSGEEAFSIFKGVEATGVKHMCAFMYRFVPALRLARQMIAAGEAWFWIVRLCSFAGNFCLLGSSVTGNSLPWGAGRLEMHSDSFPLY